MGILTRIQGTLRRSRRPVLALRPGIPVGVPGIHCLTDPAAFRELLLERIGRARRRIYITALYLQDDGAGREIMDALYAAARAQPGLDIRVLVDWHRAQRGLIGKGKSPGNAAMYLEYANRFGPLVQVVGVPVQTREVFGVLHLKGFILDDAVLYSGASLNDIYLARQGRYRLDRYHLFESPALADSMADYLRRVILASPAVRPLNRPPEPGARRHAADIQAFRRRLRTARYEFQGPEPGPGDVAITPLVGFGRTGNALNAALLALVAATRRKLVIYTPYFNLPGTLDRALAQLLAQGVEVLMVVGDKTANDFFIPPTEPFKAIGLLPYLYEANLRRFALKHRRAMEEGRLKIHLWRHGTDSFHLKGVFLDEGVAVITGNNLNPRAWTLDLENALVIRDPGGLLTGMHAQEREAILAHAPRLGSYRELETPHHYPPKVQRALKHLNRVRLDRLLNRFL